MRYLIASLFLLAAVPVAAQVYLGHGSMVAERQANQLDSGEFGFGQSVLRFDDQLIVGAASEMSFVGELVFYRRTGGVWVEFQRITPSFASSGIGMFGYSLARVGDFVVVGAPFSTVDGETRAGVVQVLTFDATEDRWTIKATLTEPAPAASSYFGVTLAVDESTLFVGAPSVGPVTLDFPGGERGDFGGRVYAFEFGTSAQPSLVATLQGDIDAAGVAFGHALAAAPGRLIVSARDTSLGMAGIFHFDTSDKPPVLVERVGRDDVGPGFFGQSLSIAGNRLLVGALGDMRSTAPNPSTMVIFDFTPAGLAEIARLDAPAHFFGFAVLMLDEQHALVGAPGDGFLYLFAEEAGQWPLVQRLVEPMQSTFRVHGFGETLTLSEGELFVGNPSALHDMGTLPSFSKGGNLYEVPLLSAPLADLSLQIVAPREVVEETTVEISFRVRGDDSTDVGAAYFDLFSEWEVASAPPGCMTLRPQIMRCEAGAITAFTTATVGLAFMVPTAPSMSSPSVRAYAGSELADPDTMGNSDGHYFSLTEAEPPPETSGGGGMLGWSWALFLLAMLKSRLRLRRSPSCSARTSVSPDSTPTSR